LTAAYSGEGPIILALIKVNDACWGATHGKNQITRQLKPFLRYMTNDFEFDKGVDKGGRIG